MLYTIQSIEKKVLHMKKIALKLQPFFILLLIMINFIAAYPTNIFHQNMSDLGNSLFHPFLMILWASSAALYFGYYTKIIVDQFDKENKRLKRILYLVCFLMILSVFIPYAPVQLPILAKWHVRCAMIATIGYVLVFFYVMYEIQKKDIALFQMILHPYLILVAFEAYLYILLGGVTTLMEASFTIIMSYYLYYIIKKLKITNS